MVLPRARRDPRSTPRPRTRARLPRSLAWLFPEVDLAQIDADRDTSFILARVLERGRMTDVEWCTRRYGMGGIRAFFRRAPHPEISDRTARFWQVVLNEENDAWPKAPSFRRASATLWSG
jgi:hypothetical protein